MGRHRKEREKKGLRVDVKYNNIEFALKKMKRMVKDSGQILELKKRSYYKKPSEEKREKKNLQSLRYKYKNLKENDSY
jgi:ribosomal protein S21